MEKLKIKQKLNRSGFTLVELVIVIAIVIILSVISVPIYRGYVDKAKWSEAYALLGTILSAQKAYYSEYGNFLSCRESSAGNFVFTNYETVLGVDARGNKYFTLFHVGDSGRDKLKEMLWAGVNIPEDLRRVAGKTRLVLHYNIDGGTTYREDAY